MPGVRACACLCHKRRHLGVDTDRAALRVCHVCVGGAARPSPAGARASPRRGRPFLAVFCAGALAQGGFKRGAERGAEGGQGGAEMEMELGAQKARRPGSTVWIDVVYTTGGLGPVR